MLICQNIQCCSFALGLVYILALAHFYTAVWEPWCTGFQEHYGTAVVVQSIAEWAWWCTPVSD